MFKRPSYGTVLIVLSLSLLACGIKGAPLIPPAESQLKE